MNASVSTIRQQLRARRRALSAVEQDIAAAFAVTHILRDPMFLRSTHIALYLPNDGELDLTDLLEPAWRMRKCCYLPVLAAPGKRLSFAPLTADSRLRPNRFGIPEPVVGHRDLRQPLQLDLVLAPLVAFDLDGNRLGMGGGYYDRSFGFLRRRKHWRRPRLIGVAHDFQRVDKLPAQSWDVPLQGIFTNAGFYPAGLHSCP